MLQPQGAVYIPLDQPGMLELHAVGLGSGCRGRQGCQVIPIAPGAQAHVPGQLTGPQRGAPLRDAQFQPLGVIEQGQTSARRASVVAAQVGADGGCDGRPRLGGQQVN